jgi:hypothetical protein
MRKFKINCEKCGSSELILRKSTTTSTVTKLKVKSDRVTEEPFVLQVQPFHEDINSVTYNLFCQCCSGDLYTSQSLKEINNYLLSISKEVEQDGNTR